MRESHFGIGNRVGKLANEAFCFLSSAFVLSYEFNLIIRGMGVGVGGRMTTGREGQ